MTISKDTDVISELKNIIDHNGPDYIHTNPYGVYQSLVDTESCDRKIENAILYVLVSDMTLDLSATDNASVDTGTDSENICIDTGPDSAALSKQIQHECSLNKKMSDRLSTIFLSLYSDSNRKEWNDRKCEGLKQFLSDDFTFTWEGFATWEPGSGYVDCHYNAEIVLKTLEKIGTDDAELAAMVGENPFISQEVISSHYADKLKRYLDYEFEDYCTEDDYYQPVEEDFEIEDYVKEWCKKNNFRFISCDGSGTDDGYEPETCRGRYW